MKGTFWNTINLHGKDIFVSMASCDKQEDLILEFFKKHKSLAFTPFEVWKSLFLETVPITSIRRGITNLTDSGHLIKTESQKTEQYGKVNYLWQYNNNQEPEQTNLF